MLHSVKKDEPLDVLHVRLFGLQAEVPQARGSFGRRHRDFLFLKILTAQRAESYCLCRCRNPCMHGQVRNELTDFFFAHFFWMTFSVKENIPPDPANVGPLRAQAEVPDTYDTPNLIQQLGRWHDLKGDLIRNVSGAV